MACFHPLKAFYTYQSDGKKKIDFYNESSFKLPYDSYPDDNKILIPCGRCSGCRLEYARQWATRCVLEAMQYEHNYFITLTYNEDSLKDCINEVPYFDKETGEYFYNFNSASLVPNHLTKFMKDLRRYFSYHFNHDDIRFFACGEYGEKYMRPHFHLILFNCPIPDLKLLKRSFNGDIYYESSILSKIWDKGFVCIGSCNFNTCSYVARYMMKKLKGDYSVFYDDNGIIPPFVRSSRRPGIARSYYDKNSDKIYDVDSIVIVGGDGKARKVRPPSYFDRLYDIDNPDKLKSIKDSRKESALNSKVKILANTDKNYDEYLEVCEYNFDSKLKKLLRPLE